LRIEEGQSTEAILDLAAALTLTRHLSTDSGLIVLLLAYNLEYRVSEAVATLLPRLDTQSLHALQDRLIALPTGGRPAEMLHFEEKNLAWIIRKVKKSRDERDLVMLLAMLVDVEEPGRGKSRVVAARKFLEECGGTSNDLLKHFEALRPTYARLAPMLDLSVDQFTQEWARIQASNAANPAFPLLFSAYPRIRLAQARAEVRRALLAAAVDVQIHGRDAVKNHPDPGRDRGALDYSPLDSGFVLRSKLEGGDGKPLAITVGR
jgi:hypothetical protein